MILSHSLKLESRPLADPNRNERVAQPGALVRQATWCGIVFAVAILLTFLNFLPPVDIKYHVRSKVVLSESRLEQLRELAISDRAAVKAGENKRIQLMAVRVLDLAKQEASVGVSETEDKVVLVELDTLWASRCTTERHYTWLKNISKSDKPRLINSKVAQAARSARWDLAAAQHYQQQNNYLASKTPLLEDTPQTSERTTFQLASFTKPETNTEVNSGNGGSEILSGNADFGLQLSDQVEQAKERVKQVEREWQLAIEQASGVMQVASVPVIAPRSSSIPFWMAASILILGLASGSTAGWFQHRNQSGGAYAASEVADRLAVDGIAIAGILSLELDHDDSTDWIDAAGRGASSAGRQAGRRLTNLSEWAVSFWAVIAMSRFFLDSAWRDVLVDSPLAALGRLMSGMP